MTYKITTSPLGYDVRRKDSDFHYLRKILVRTYPHLVVPPCLGASLTKASPKGIEKRERYYNRFLQAVMRSEELKHSQFLLDFLFEEDLKNYAKVVKDSEKLLGPR